MQYPIVLYCVAKVQLPVGQFAETRVFPGLKIPELMADCIPSPILTRPAPAWLSPGEPKNAFVLGIEALLLDIWSQL